MKKKANKEQIDTLKSSLYFKIFDILKLDNQTYYLDKEFNLIWDIKKEVVGIINNKNYLFFSDIDKMIDSLNKEFI
jgi:hypothetical protein